METAARQVSRSSKLPAPSDCACLGPFSGIDVHLLGSERASQARVVVCVCRAGEEREADADAVGCDGCAFGTCDVGPRENHPSDLRRPASVPKTPTISVAVSTAALSNLAVVLPRRQQRTQTSQQLRSRTAQWNLSRLPLPPVFGVCRLC